MLGGTGRDGQIGAFRFPPELRRADGFLQRLARRRRWGRLVSTATPSLDEDPAVSVYVGRELVGLIFDRREGALRPTPSRRPIGRFPTWKEALDRNPRGAQYGRGGRMITRVIGVDPGVTGAFAVIGELGRLVATNDLPVVSNMVSPALLVDILEHWSPASVCIERVSAMRGWGVASSCRFGRAVGTVEGAVGRYCCPSPLCRRRRGEGIFTSSAGTRN